MTTNNKSVSNDAIIAASFAMFPWLGEHFKPTEINSVKFKRPTLELLRASGGMRSSGELVSIYFFDSTGQLLGKNQRREEIRTLPLRKFLLFGKKIKFTYYGEQESVVQTIARINPGMEKIHYIVGLRSKGYTDNTLYITCPPKGMAFAEVLKEEKKAAEKVVRQALENLAS